MNQKIESEKETIEGMGNISQIDWEVAARHLPFTRIAVLGAGTMGSQIAAHFANAGASVLLLDITGGEGKDSNHIVSGAFKKMKAMKPDPLFTSQTAGTISLGNFDDDFSKLSGVDWVIEAVIERLDIKRSIMERLEMVIGDETVVSTNTSGIPIATIAAERSEEFRKRFLGTHFFNPPRYLSLLELIPTSETDPDVLARVASFARIHLGKGIVIAKDRPYFIGNRVGIFAMLVAIEERSKQGMSIEEIDMLTGPLVGRPKSGTFRTADVVGLDVMKAVIENLYTTIPDDESRDVFRVPEELEMLVSAGALGAKTKAGYYKKVGREIQSFDTSSKQYSLPDPLQLPEIDEIRNAGSLDARLKALYDSDSRSGSFFRNTLHRILGYAARRIPEITDTPSNIDRAISWGFGWKKGPFEIWDVIGFDRVLSDLRDAGEVLPEWITEMASSGASAFYATAGIGDGEVTQKSMGSVQVYQPALKSHVSDSAPADENGLSFYKMDHGGVAWSNDSANLYQSADGVAVLEFCSKANTMGAAVLLAIQEAIELVEANRDLRGLVIANEGSNFSVGANLGELAMTLEAGQFEAVSYAVARFQDTIQRVRYARKPVVVTVHQRVLGGACELVMASTHPVAAAESYIGLVESGVGLIPAGTGTMRLAAMASDLAPSGFPSEVQSALAPYFEQVAMARVATSARHAQQMGYLSRAAPIVMRAERRIHVAHREVIRLSAQGYVPPPQDRKIRVGGKDIAAALNMMAYQFLQGGYISEYDFELARTIAYVMTGGNLNGQTPVSEQYILDLEREAFMRLVGETRTQDRIRHLLEHNKPLRN